MRAFSCAPRRASFISGVVLAVAEVGARQIPSSAMERLKVCRRQHGKQDQVIKMSIETISVAFPAEHPHVMMVTIDNPPVNAMTTAMYGRLQEIFSSIESDGKVRCVVLTASGSAPSSPAAIRGNTRRWSRNRRSFVRGSYDLRSRLSEIALFLSSRQLMDLRSGQALPSPRLLTWLWRARTHRLGYLRFSSAFLEG